MNKIVLHSLSLLQRLLSLWQQQQQSRKHRERLKWRVEDCGLDIGTTFNHDSFLTEEQLEVILKILCDQAGIARSNHPSSSSTSQQYRTVTYPTNSQSGIQTPPSTLPVHRPLDPRPFPASPDVETIQLKILQTILQLFSVDTPLITFLPVGSPSYSSSTSVSQQADLSISGSSSLELSSSTYVDTSCLGPHHSPTPSLPKCYKQSSCPPDDPINNQNACRLAYQRVYQLLFLLVSLHEESPFPSVRHTAVAGLTQFLRFVLDGAAIAVRDAVDRSSRGAWLTFIDSRAQWNLIVDAIFPFI